MAFRKRRGDGKRRESWSSSGFRMFHFQQQHPHSPSIVTLPRAAAYIHHRSDVRPRRLRPSFLHRSLGARVRGRDPLRTFHLCVTFDVSSLRLSSEVGFKQWIEKAIDSPDPSVREEETSFCLQNVNAVIALIKFDTAAAPFEVAGVSSSGEKE